MRSPKQAFSGSCMSRSEQILADRIWKAIKQTQTFTVDAIAVRTQLALNEVQAYVFWLTRCKYVEYLGGNCRLLRDTGNLAPIATREGFLDPNLV